MTCRGVVELGMQPWGLQSSHTSASFTPLSPLHLTHPAPDIPCVPATLLGTGEMGLRDSLSPRGSAC